MELAGIVYTGIHPKVSIEFLRRGKQVKGTHFRKQDDCAQETDARQGLEKGDTVMDQTFLSVYRQPYAVLRECRPDVPGIPGRVLYTAGSGGRY